MPRRLTKFVAIALLFCVPLQALAALVMPLAMASPMAPASAGMAAADSGRHDAMAPCAHGEDGGLPARTAPDGERPGSHSGAGACDSCALCHLANNAIAAVGLQSPAPGPARHYTSPAAQRYASHIPEQPQRPPGAA